MTDATYIPERPQTVPLPKPQPLAAPVLISDAASPLAGATVLTCLWRHLDRQRGED